MLKFILYHVVWRSLVFPDRYGYSHYLHEKVFAPCGVQWLWQDIVCQYWPWAQSKSPLFSQSRAMEMKPALSVMHAKAHSWHCQVCICSYVNVLSSTAFCISTLTIDGIQHTYLRMYSVCILSLLINLSRSYIAMYVICADTMGRQMAKWCWSRRWRRYGTILLLHVSLGLFNKKHDCSK